MKKTFMKMQSLSRKALLCGGLIAMAAAITGCSSDAPDPGENPTPGVVQTDGDPLTVISDQATLSGLVLNYASNDNSDAPKAYTMPKVPDYSDAVSVRSEGFAITNLDNYKGGIIIPKEGYKGLLDLYGKSIKVFVAGTFEGDIKGGENAEVHILKGGVWKVGSETLGTPALKIYDYDNGLVCPEGDIDMNCSYYGKVFNQPGRTFTVKNEKMNLFVENEINVGGLVLNCKAQISAWCLTAAMVDITDGGKCYIGAYMDVTGNLWLQRGGRVYLNKGANVKVYNYLDCVDEQSGFDSPDGKAVIYAKEYYFGENKDNVPGQFKGVINVYAHEIKNGTSETNSTEEYKGAELTYSADMIKIRVDGEDGFDFDPDSMKGCPPHEAKPEPEPEDPKLPDMPVVIINITGTHAHPISATSIDVWNNYAYVSWHERGGNIRGCIEAIEIDGLNAGVRSWMETASWKYGTDKDSENAATAYDFNHVIYDPAANALITVGEHAKKGGFIGRIKLGETFGNNATINVLENRQLGVEKYSGNDLQGLVAGGSGNSVVISPDGKYLLVASRGGYLSIPYTGSGYPDPFAKGEDGKNLVASKDIKARATAGSGKHIALFGNQVVSIEYTAPNPHEKNEEEWWEDNTTALEAKISLWDKWENFPEGEPKTTTNVQAFSPVFGKDVIAMDASGIYSCQGHNGVAKYDVNLGGEQKRFNVDKYIRDNRKYFKKEDIARMTGAAANGLAVDDRYLYIAYGAAGLWVLDKETFEPVGFYTAAGKYTYPENKNKENPKASANYVRVMNDGKIFVAYGRDGVKVLEMESTQKARGKK